MERHAQVDCGAYALRLTLQTKTLEMHSLLQPHQHTIDALLAQRISELAPQCDILGIVAQVAEPAGRG